MTVSVGPVKGHPLNLSELRSDTQASVRGLCRAHSAGSCLDVADTALNLGRAEDQRLSNDRHIRSLLLARAGRDGLQHRVF